MVAPATDLPVEFGIGGCLYLYTIYPAVPLYTEGRQASTYTRVCQPMSEHPVLCFRIVCIGGCLYAAQLQVSWTLCRLSKTTGLLDALYNLFLTTGFLGAL